MRSLTRSSSRSRCRPVSSWVTVISPSSADHDVAHEPVVVGAVGEVEHVAAADHPDQLLLLEDRVEALAVLSVPGLHVIERGELIEGRAQWPVAGQRDHRGGHDLAREHHLERVDGVLPGQVEAPARDLLGEHGSFEQQRRCQVGDRGGDHDREHRTPHVGELEGEHDPGQR